ncbi:MAG: hypothetical protein PHY80_01910 [Rickettsiales bacterium]|nr:hypothetical protein [Rickettsiales bacterium]
METKKIEPKSKLLRGSTTILESEPTVCKLHRSNSVHDFSTFPAYIEFVEKQKEEELTRKRAHTTQ